MPPLAAQPRSRPVAKITDYDVATRADLVARLRARRTEIVAAVFVRVRDGVSDPVGLKDAAYLSGLRAAVAAVVDYGFTGIEQAEDCSEPIPSVAVAQAHRAARIGVSLGTVLLRYTAGYALLEGFVVEEAENSDCLIQGSSLRHVLSAYASSLERLATSIIEAYGRELERTERSLEQRRAEQVHNLLAGGQIGMGALGYEFDAWHLGVIATGGRAREALREMATVADRQLLTLPLGEETIWAWLGGQRRLAVADLERLLSANGKSISLAIGEPARGIDGWRKTHAQAQAARLVALKRPRAMTQYAEEMLLVAALQDETLASSLTEMYLSPLASQRDGGGISRETLRAYLRAGGNASSAASALGVARHTVASRLKIIEQLFDRRLCVCLTELDVALRLEDLNGSGDTESASPTDR